jgi:argininosuccinate synthase
MTAQKIIVAFSGGLDTTYCAAWLRETTDAEITTVTIDTGGFAPGELEEIAAASKRAGAHQHLSVDGTHEVFDRIVSRLIQGNVLRGGVYPLCVSAERIVQAELLVRQAQELGADAIAHGSTGAGNDQVRFDVSFRTLAPEIEILAPIRDQALSREQESEWLNDHGIPVSASTTTYSVNTGMWGTTIGGGALHDPWSSVPDEAFPNVVAPELAPAEGAAVQIGFEGGIPRSLDGTPLTGPELVRQLNSIGATHGIGRGVHLGDTILGIKGRIAFEAPAAMILIAAHRELEKLVLTRWQRFWKDQLSEFLGTLVHEAMVHDPVFDDIGAMIESSQSRVTGSTRVSLKRGLLEVEGITSPYSLIDEARAVYGETQSLWSGADAAGFTRIYGLQGALAHRARIRARSTDGGKP